jgi:hypothetical protein
VVVAAIFIASACSIHTQQKAAGATASGTTTPETALLYSDQSAGALWHAYAWHAAATSRGVAVTYTNDVEDFTLRLAAGNWTTVVVMSRFSGSEPTYVNAVRGYASSHPEAAVEFRVWHDNGIAAPPLTAAFGTTAVVLWYAGSTSTGYALADGPGAAKPAASVPGHVFPTFQDVQPRRWTATWSVSAESLGRAAAVPPDPVPAIEACKNACLQNWVKETKDCDDKRTIRIAQCDSLYGPGAANPSPSQYASCVATANTDHTNCTTAAGNSYHFCILVCELPPL